MTRTARGARRQQHAVGGRWGADRGQDVGWKAPDARNHECLMGPHRAHSRAAQLFAPTSSSCSSGKDLFFGAKNKLNTGGS